MEHLKDDMQRRNLITLWDISDWNLDDSWKSWVIPCPIQLESVKEQLLINLKGKSPESRKDKDSRGWGDNFGSYSTSAGYKLLSNPRNTENPAIWKSI